MKKKVVILGSTGSIGKSTLSVIEAQKEKFEIVGLSCKENVKALNRQIKKVKPKFVCVFDEKKKRFVRDENCTVLTGMEGLIEMIHTNPDIVVNAIPGSLGLTPTIEALGSSKVLALANKESIVMAGRIIEGYVKKNNVKLIPVDSEHSALYQLLKKTNRNEVKSIILTASGGPFKDLSKKDLRKVKPEDALKHPVWKMGKKVTLDSATLMNKGLEIIEARWLFGFDWDRIRVVIHPESILHGLVELVDDSFIGYMSFPDMRIPISYALNEEERQPVGIKSLSMDKLLKMTFYPPDLKRFPALKLAYDALREGDSAQICFNTSNEVVSSAFLERKVRFTDIPLIVEKVLETHPRIPVIEDIECVWEVYKWAKAFTERLIKERAK
ncbi:MAG: 1-deoxy-D-xylulose-5-phosphate reductoisomerase [Desulfobacterota bacterium]|nr:1-deoxy-D-xylulose-5-phosphate reductoisomerase [Thermodesulfobacteriota bacterium]MDW8001441.1 1-deoxy-D-xylulose-5-phosphate reductoisomerase [Deltaproteobacteria bacterium]